MTRRLILIRHGQTTYTATGRMQGHLDTELSEVGCAVEEQGENLLVTPATWRTDITMDVDLIEEVLRL